MIWKWAGIRRAFGIASLVNAVRGRPLRAVPTHSPSATNEVNAVAWEGKVMNEIDLVIYHAGGKRCESCGEPLGEMTCHKSQSRFYCAKPECRYPRGMMVPIKFIAPDKRWPEIQQNSDPTSAIAAIQH